MDDEGRSDKTLANSVYRNMLERRAPSSDTGKEWSKDRHHKENKRSKNRHPQPGVTRLGPGQLCFTLKYQRHNKKSTANRILQQYSSTIHPRLTLISSALFVFVFITGEGGHHKNTTMGLSDCG